MGHACCFFFGCPPVDIDGVNVAPVSACTDLAGVVESASVNFLFLDNVWGPDS